jgi:DnaJ-class molecular chaperone
MDYKDYYSVLGVARDADDKAIKTAYRRLARKHHPDVNKGKADRFKEINEAYAVLSDPEKRKRYDTLGPDWERYARTGADAPFEGADPRAGGGMGGAAGGDFSDFFRTIFGDLGGTGRRGRVRDTRRGGMGDIFTGEWTAGGGPETDKGDDVEAAVEVTLEDAFRGVTRRVALEISEPCAACGGAGHTGRTPCAECRGSGWSKSPRNLDVKIPAGVDTGSRIRVAGEGPRGLGQGPRGDLYLRVTVKPDARFERKGDNLHVDLAVPAADAALGAEIQVPTLKGNVSMKIPPETSSGKTFRLPGYGLPHLKGGGSGDQYVRVQVAIPAGLTAREKELFAELRTLRAERAR